MIGRIRTHSFETKPSSIERKASRLHDPVAKLRYLRAAAQGRRSSNRWHLAVYVAVGLALVSPPAKPRGVPAHLPPPIATPEPTGIFMVERKPAGETYSNGLFIRSGYEAKAAPRSYRRFDRSALRFADWQTRPAGIVFHTTESLVLAIEPDQAGALSRTKEDLLSHARRDRLYNFVIDRFGQVFRIVPEDQVALHAGHSVWADDAFVFIDLNESFLGVAFEMKAGESATEAQRHQGRLLTEMLRSVYKIADGSCVTHAQVSINPDNQRIGYHTDWGGGISLRRCRAFGRLPRAHSRGGDLWI
jgi:hypothetical protein